VDSLFILTVEFCCAPRHRALCQGSTSPIAPLKAARFDSVDLVPTINLKAWRGGLCIVPRSEPARGRTIGINPGDFALQFLAP
jgi:hypothetical protein